MSLSVSTPGNIPIAFPSMDYICWRIYVKVIFLERFCLTLARASFVTPPPGALTDSTAKNCPWCMASVINKVKETGEFWAWSNYFWTGCRWTESILQPPTLMLLDDTVGKYTQLAHTYVPSRCGQSSRSLCDRALSLGPRRRTRACIFEEPVSRVTLWSEIAYRAQPQKQPKQPLHTITRTAYKHVW